MSLFDRSGMRGITNKKPKKNDQIVISAPLGDVRHVSHIGRDGADFGEEHLFQAKSRNNSVPKTTSKTTRQSYVSQHDSPIIKSAIPLHQAASIIKLDNKTESHDSGNFDQNPTENASYTGHASVVDNNSNSHTATNSLGSVQSQQHQQNLTINNAIPMAPGLTPNAKGRNLVASLSAGMPGGLPGLQSSPVPGGNINNNNNTVNSSNSTNTRHSQMQSTPPIDSEANSGYTANMHSITNLQNVPNNRISMQVHYPTAPGAPGPPRNKIAAQLSNSAKQVIPVENRYFNNSKHSLDSLSDLDTVGSLNGIEKTQADKEESTSLLGDVLAVMSLDKFANIPGVRQTAFKSNSNKSDLNGSLEELNSSQFTTKSEDGAGVTDGTNMEAISENSREFEVGDMLISSTNTNNTSSNFSNSSIEHSDQSNQSGSLRKPHKRLKKPVHATKSLDCYTNATNSAHQTVTHQHSNNSAIRSIAMRNQSFQSSQKQLITDTSSHSIQHSREPSVKLYPLKVSSGSEISTDEIAL